MPLFFRIRALNKKKKKEEEEEEKREEKAEGRRFKFIAGTDRSFLFFTPI